METYLPWLFHWWSIHIPSLHRWLVLFLFHFHIFSSSRCPCRVVWFPILPRCWIYFQNKVSIWNINCARATAFIFYTRTGVFVKVSQILRQKMTRPEGDSNPQSSDSCRILQLFELSGPNICCPMFLNTGSGGKSYWYHLFSWVENGFLFCLSFHSNYFCGNLHESLFCLGFIVITLACCWVLGGFSFVCCWFALGHTYASHSFYWKGSWGCSGVL